MLNHFRNKSVLITGGLGFIGSNLARALVNLGAQVTLFDNLDPESGGCMQNVADIRADVCIEIGDIRDREMLACHLKNKDFLFNLAARTSHQGSMQDPKTDFEVNAYAQLQLLELVRAVNPDLKIVFASTRQIYGVPNYLPVDESHPIKPVDVNGINKFAGESYHILYNNIYGIRASVLRLTNTFGPGMRVKDARQTFIGIWIRHLLEGNPIKVFGDGNQLRDFTFIDDCVQALLMVGCLEKADGQVYNLGGSEAIRLLDLAEYLIRIYSRGSFEIIPFSKLGKSIDIGDFYADYSKISVDLGWRPQVTLEQGLRKTLDFYADFGKFYGVTG